MRVLQVSEEHGRYVATMAETELPVPRPGEALVRVAASGVNRADLSQIAGRYPPPPGESEILGLEVSGTIADTGQPVCALLAGGGHAEYAAVPVGQLLPAPRALRPGGRVILLATLSGSSAELDIALLMKKRGRLIGSMLRGRSRDEKAQIVARFGNEILPAFETGRLRVTIDSVFPPERAAAAFQRMRENRNTGKILIDWSGVATPGHLRRR